KVITSLIPPDFEREEVDAGIRIGNGQWKGVHSYKLMPNELVPVCTPEKAKKLRTPQDLADEILLHTTSNPHFWSVWLKAAGVPELHDNRGLHYQASLLTYEAALEGLGVAIAQKAMIQKELDEGRLVMPFDLVVDMGDESYYFVLPKTSYRRSSLQLKQFRDWVASCAI